MTRYILMISDSTETVKQNFLKAVKEVKDSGYNECCMRYSKDEFMKVFLVKSTDENMETIVLWMKPVSSTLQYLRNINDSADEYLDMIYIEFLSAGYGFLSALSNMLKRGVLILKTGLYDVSSLNPDEEKEMSTNDIVYLCNAIKCITNKNYTLGKTVTYKSLVATLQDKMF